MRCDILPVALAFLAVAERTLAQCSDPCTVTISVDAATAFEEDSEISAIDANAALTSINDADVLSDEDSDPPDRRRALRRRQGSSVCCNADETCLSSDGIPFCFNPATTEVRSGDGSYGFIANSSYYAPDGSPIDPSTGATLSAGGSTGVSAPTSAAMSMASGVDSLTIAASSTEVSASTSAAMSIASSSGSSTIGVTTSTAKSASAEGPSTSSATTATNSAPGISTESEPATVSSSSPKATGQASSSRVEFGKLAAAAGLVIFWIVGDLGFLMLI